MDPDFHIEDNTVFCADDDEDILNDVCEDVFDDHCPDPSDFDTNVEQGIKDSLYTARSEADQLALAMGFGEFIVNGKKVYDVDENTDRENWEKTMSLYPLQDQPNSNNLNTFEHYINDITSGLHKGPWVQH